MFQPLFFPMLGAIDFDPSLFSLIRGTNNFAPHHRSPGDRAHKRWKRRRATGRR